MIGPKPAGAGVSARDRIGCPGSSTVGSSGVRYPFPTGFIGYSGPPNALAQVIGMLTNGAGSEIAGPSIRSVQTRRPITRSAFDHAPTPKSTVHSSTALLPGAWQLALSSTSALRLKSAKSPPYRHSPRRSSSSS
ncbi:hypothetical protein BE20_27985 [Sorangium cellulosum]|nr:hypothetical protein BE20_27985 [Sorangium cellulosum]